VEAEKLDEIKRYLELVKRRANGSLDTAATFIRNFVRSHPNYKHNSVVSQEINYDLMVAMDKM
jgi:glutamate--cysteine ligase catalytic subunit